MFSSVLDLDAFERNTKSEGLGVGSEGCAGQKNMHDAEFTTILFRFIQLTSEGHNLGKIHTYTSRIVRFFENFGFFIRLAISVSKTLKKAHVLNAISFFYIFILK